MKVRFVLLLSPAGYKDVVGKGEDESPKGMRKNSQSLKGVMMMAILGMSTNGTGICW